MKVKFSLKTVVVVLIRWMNINDASNENPQNMYEKSRVFESSLSNETFKPWPCPHMTLGQNFFISWFTNPPTVIFRKVGKK